MKLEERERISEAPWNGSSSRFTDEQWERSCALDRKSCGGEWASAPPKTRCSLPYKEPGGEISRAGVHAAASRINQVTGACSGAVSSAKGKLRSAYKALGEDAPASLGSGGTNSVEDMLEAFRGEFVEAGVARHGQISLRMDEDTEVLVRDDSNGEYIGTLHGHFCVFNRWTEIRSFFEGNFLERIAPGACKKTFVDNRLGMRCLFQHGRDPVIGMKPLGPIRELEEDKTGGRYEVPLLDTSYNRDLLPALKEQQSLYGASFRFEVLREEVVTDPPRSEHNPKGIEERTITEMRVREFGPVTFPAYQEATAGARSLTDWWAHPDPQAHPDSMRMNLAWVLGFASLRAGDAAELFEVKDLETLAASAGGGAAPSSGAPDGTEEREEQGDSEAETADEAKPTPPSRVQSTRLTGAARRPLRASRDEDAPPWKLS